MTSSNSLESTLRGSSLFVLEILFQSLLCRMGYGDVQLLGRRHPRQKSQDGGHEMVCFTRIGSEPAKVVVKILTEDIRLRNLDEMCGVIARTHANLGFVLTTGQLTVGARKHRDFHTRNRVEALDGSALAELMRKHNLGIRSNGEPDYAFFAELEHQADRFLAFLRGAPR